jgi:DNA-directed RNA polymerase subunit RPC12/RpoP
MKVKNCFVDAWLVILDFLSKLIAILVAKAKTKANRWSYRTRGKYSNISFSTAWSPKKVMRMSTLYDQIRLSNHKRAMLWLRILDHHLDIQKWLLKQSNSILRAQNAELQHWLQDHVCRAEGHDFKDGECQNCGFKYSRHVFHCAICGKVIWDLMDPSMMTEALQLEAQGDCICADCELQTIIKESENWEHGL